MTTAMPTYPPPSPPPPTAEPVAANVTTAVVFALGAAALVILTRVVIVPWIESANGWVIPQDAWTPLPAARSISNGDLFHMYEPLVGRTGYPYTPGLPILLAPFVAIGDHFRLLGSYNYTHLRPALFLILGPAEAFVGILPVAYVTGRAVRATGRRMWWIQGLVFIVAAWSPVAWFHPEDTIACALLVAACLRAGSDDGDWRIVGALVGAALLFKQWALWPAIPIVLAAPRGKRSITAFYAFALAALLLAPFLLASSAAWSSLAGTRASLQFGQPQLWLHLAFGHHELANATLLRAAWGGAALLVTARLRRAPGPDALLAAVGTVMLLRLFFEPVLFGYYLVPAAVIALIWCARNGRPLALRALTASLLVAFCFPQTFPQPVFYVIFAVGLGYVCGPMVAALHPPYRRDDGINTMPGSRRFGHRGEGSPDGTSSTAPVSSSSTSR